ncbi:hypothetical protein M9Y10_011892 [Tritrichomonas musculus]|uniref:Beige/BEACH domain containing protein n=1 Tax=Tritrichomonas musculus TaxID=1915356 RepID=A0ABR2IBT1_9EUKA
MSLDSINDLVNSILSMAITKAVPQDNIPKDIVKDVKLLFPQKISRQQIHKFKDFISKGDSCFEAITKSNITFPFKPDLLIQMIVYTNFIEKEPNISSAIILFSFLSWCVDHYNNNGSEYLSIVFEVLKTLAINCKQQPNIKSIAISSIYNLLIMILPKKLEDIDFTAKIEIINGIILSIPSLPPYFFDVFVKTSHILVDNPVLIEKSSRLFIDLINKTLKQYPDRFPIKVIDIISPIIAQQIISFNEKTVEYVPLVYQVFGLETAQQYLAAFLLLFGSQIKQNSILPKSDQFKGVSNYLSLPVLATDQMQNNYLVKHEVDLAGHVDFNVMQVQLTEPEDLPNIISPNLISLLNIITTEFKGRKVLVSELISVATNLYSQGEFNNSYDGISFFILLVTDLYESYKFAIPTEILFHETIFSPSFTVFKQEENWRILNSMRNAVIKLLVHSEVDKLFKFINDSSKYPHLFTELMYRFSNYVDEIEINPNTILLYNSLLLENNNYYQSLTDLTSDQVNIVREARFSIFYVLNKLIQTNDQIIDSFFTNEKFMSNYAQLIFEDTLLPLLFFTFSIYSKRTLITEESIFNISINHVLKEASKRFEDEVIVTKCFTFLNTTNDFILNDDNLLQMFERAIPSFCYCLTLLPKSNSAESFLICAINFLTLESKFHKLKSIESVALETALIQNCGENVPIKFFDSLIQLAAGSTAANRDSSFIIEQPKSFRILLRVYSNTPILTDIISFIDRLCKLSDINIKKIHEEGIDNDLLEILQNYREKDPDDQKLKIVNDILSLFYNIASYASSVITVEKYISLFCLVDGRYLPWFHPQTIDTFISLLSKQTNEESCVIPFNNSSRFQVINIKNEMLLKGFTFCCWIFSNMSLFDYSEHLITIYDKKGQEMTIFHTWSSLVIKSTNQNPVEVEFILTSHEWTLVSVSFKIVNDSFVISIYNNEQLVKEVTTPFVRFERSIHPLNCQIGGISENSIDVDNPSTASQFALYPYLEYNQVKALQQLGCNATELEFNPYFVFIPDKPFESTVIHNIVSNSPIVSLTEVPSLSPSPFSDIFIKRCGVDLILPIFAQWRMSFKDETEMNDLPEKSILILTQSLIRNEEVQRSFDEAHGIEIVSFLLQSAKKKIINFSLYKSFYNLFVKLSDKQLKEHFFTSILSNIDIWINTEGEDHLKIIKSWKQNLFPHCMDLAVKDRSFKWIINVMRIYYYYTKCEPDIQRERPDDLDIVEIRKLLIVIAVGLACINFNSSDLCYLICTITSCPDSSQQMDYFRIFNELIKKGSCSPIRKASDSYAYIKILQYLANSKNKDISIVSMQTLVNAYHSSFFTSTCDCMIDIILHEISKEMISKEYFQSLLIAVKKDTPELFPIMAWMAMNLGEETINKMYDEVTPSEKFIQGCSWCVWAIITMYRFSATIARKIASFLIRCSIMNFEQLYSFIDVVGMVMKRSTDDMKSILLDELNKVLKSSKETTDKQILIYLTFTRHFLFFRAVPNEKDKLDKLDKLVKDSPFADQVPEIPQIRQFQELINILRTRPKFNADGSDRYSPDMAQKALQIIAPRMNDEEVINLQNQQKLKENTEKTGSFPKANAFPTVGFAKPIAAPQTTQRKNLMRRNSIFTITKPTESSTTRQPQRSLRIAPTPNKGRRGARFVISSQMNYLLANDSLAIYSELFFNPIHYIFGIRQGSLSNAETNEYMINWLDKDIAIEFLNTYLSNPFPEFESTVVLIASYLIFQDPDLALRTLSKVNVEKQQYTGSLSFFDRNAVRSKQVPVFSKATEVDFTPKYNTFLNNFTTQNDEKINLGWKRIIDQIKDYEDKNSHSANETFGLLTASLVAVTTDAIADFCDDISQVKTQSNKYWQQLWHCISIERAPWNKSLPPNMIQLSHYRRDLSICFAGFSPKLKNNYKFDIHLEASVVRDTGDEETGKSKTEELKEQLKNMYAQGSEIYSLFEISDTSMKEKNNNIFTATKYIIELPCEVIKIDKTYEEASFLLLENSIVLTIIDKKSTVIDLDTVKSIFPRTRCHHMTAIEIFTNDGDSYFVNFPNFSSAQVLKSFRDKSKIQPCDFKQSLAQTKMTEKWQHREISNFQYLMALNLHSGRSTNDLSQYPVFPWIISDYESEELDLNNPAVYRDLSKPIGAVNEARLNELKDKSEQLEAMGMTPYLYSSCFSCPFVVCLFMIRLEPFTSLHIDIQGGHFDVPSRIFSSVSEAYKLCKTNHNDYRELIPEFFLMPEFLVNRDHFDLGISSGKKIDDVVLPKWAHDNPLEFIYKNRKALESEYVTQNLNNWIDLMWGDKQRGEKAWKADNVYLREMYADIWDVTPLDDVNQRANVEAILTHVGQIPPMLFDKPHPVVDPLPSKTSIAPIYEELKLPITAELMSIYLKQSDKNVFAYAIDVNNKFYWFSYDPIEVPEINSKNSKMVQSRSRTTSLLIKSNMNESQDNLEMASKKRTGSFVDRANSSTLSADPAASSPSYSSSSFFGGKHAHRGIRSFIHNSASYDLQQFSSDAEDDSSNNKSDDRSHFSESSSFSESSNLFLSGNPTGTNSSFSSIIATNQKKKKSNRHKCSFNDNNTFFFTKGKIHNVFKVSKSSNSSQICFKQRSEIKAIASDYKWTAVADGDSVISIYYDECLKFTIPLFSSSIKCLAISSSYHLLVCGTKDGFLLFCSLNTGTVVKTVNLNGMKPMKLLITPSWGFVAVSIAELEEGKIIDYIKLFTINGDLIISRKIKSHVQAWKAFSTYHGFDYILMADSNNDCFFFEAFYLNIEKPFYTSDKQVSALAYVQNCNCVVLAADSGHLTFVTALLPE